MSYERLSVWDDPNVKAALKDGRALDDIAVLPCPDCGLFGYYNHGSHFTCRHCDVRWRVAAEDEEFEDDVRPLIDASEALTMQNVVDGECEDYP